MYFDLIIEDDSGETEKQEDIVPYQLSKEAIVMEMSVKDIKVWILSLLKLLMKIASLSGKAGQHW